MKDDAIAAMRNFTLSYNADICHLIQSSNLFFDVLEERDRSNSVFRIIRVKRKGGKKK